MRSVYQMKTSREQALSKSRLCLALKIMEDLQLLFPATGIPNRIRTYSDVLVFIASMFEF
jgi:hypothetical protein